ncbi:MAG: DUF2829 domain-containing protein [Peptostreptococcaceae bacterium]|nr:DUF2829 domain-containing protein [Peptostreptococcaceae bacterium]
MNFGEAIQRMKNGESVLRRVWGKKSLFLVKGTVLHNIITETYGNGVPEETPKVENSIAMYSAEERKVLVGWIPSLEDILAEDWEVL